MKSNIIINSVTYTTLPTLMQNSYGFIIEFNLLDDLGVALDLTGKTVDFKLESISSSTFKINATTTVVNATLGKLSYTTQATDFNEIGIYEAELAINSGTTKDTIKLGTNAIIGNI